MTTIGRGLFTAAALALVIAVGSPASAATPDSWITTKVKMSLLTTEGVGSNSINVDTIDGRVTLHGTVDSNDEKAKAELAAQKIDGVREVRNLLQVVPPAAQAGVKANDDEIKTEVSAALKRDQALSDSDISVSSVNAGTVVLTGDAKTMSDHLRALEVASAVPGVHAVASEIKSPDTLSDREIWDDTTTTAKGAGESIKDAAKDSAAAVKHAGKVAADGAVDVSKSAAGTVADASRSTAGTVKDAWITSNAKVRLMANGDTPASDINVDTMNGKVTLFGTVPTAAAKTEAENEVKKISGVKSVANELSVVAESAEKQVAANDKDIETRVEERLEKNAGISKDVDVEVSNANVRLTGTVDSQSERLQAITTARATAGVRSVIDSLQIRHASR